MQWTGDDLGKYPKDRLETLGVFIKSWRKTGRNVIVCPISSAVGEFYGIKPSLWLKLVIEEIQRYTDRPVVIKPKDSDSTLWSVLLDAWCIVAYNSNAALEAIVNGVPAFVLGPAASRGMAETSLSKIETPKYPENRELWLCGLSYQQWTLDEIRAGKCWEWLT